MNNTNESDYLKEGRAIMARLEALGFRGLAPALPMPPIEAEQPSVSEISLPQGLAEEGLPPQENEEEVTEISWEAAIDDDDPMAIEWQFAAPAEPDAAEATTAPLVPASPEREAPRETAEEYQEALAGRPLHDLLEGRGDPAGKFSQLTIARPLAIVPGDEVEAPQFEEERAAAEPWPASQEAVRPTIIIRAGGSQVEAADSFLKATPALAIEKRRPEPVVIDISGNVHDCQPQAADQSQSPILPSEAPPAPEEPTIAEPVADEAPSQPAKKSRPKRKAFWVVLPIAAVLAIAFALGVYVVDSHHRALVAQDDGQPILTLPDDGVKPKGNLAAIAPPEKADEALATPEIAEGQQAEHQEPANDFLTADDLMKEPIAFGTFGAGFWPAASSNAVPQKRYFGSPYDMSPQVLTRAFYSQRDGGQITQKAYFSRESAHSVTAYMVERRTFGGTSFGLDDWADLETRALLSEGDGDQGDMKAPLDLMAALYGNGPADAAPGYGAPSPFVAHPERLKVLDTVFTPGVRQSMVRMASLAPASISSAAGAVATSGRQGYTLTASPDQLTLGEVTDVTFTLRKDGHPASSKGFVPYFSASADIPGLRNVARPLDTSGSFTVKGLQAVKAGTVPLRLMVDDNASVTVAMTVLDPDKPQEKPLMVAGTAPLPPKAAAPERIVITPPIMDDPDMVVSSPVTATAPAKKTVKKNAKKAFTTEDLAAPPMTAPAPVAKTAQAKALPVAPSAGGGSSPATVATPLSFPVKKDGSLDASKPIASPAKGDDISDPLAYRPPTSLPKWMIVPGLLRGQLEHWSNSAGYQMVWKAKNDYEMASTAVFDRDFVDAVRGLIGGMHKQGNLLRATFYKGNKVLEISEE